MIRWYCIFLFLFGAIPTIANRIAKLFILFSFKRAKLKLSESKKNDYFNGSPRVAIHVAIRNEDPTIVLNTLTSLKKQDYPNFKVMVIDNNTTDEKKWRPVETFCNINSNIFSFWHIERLEGYKAGALNYLLKLTTPDFKFIAVVDADTKVSPSFLKETMKYFSDDKIAIVQTPLGFEVDPSQHKFRRWIYLIYRYFLGLYMPAADYYNKAPFIGCMGILRKQALEEVGGWNELYLTEDMELSCRLFQSGYNSRYVNLYLGKSNPPADLKNFLRQHYRWNFGNTQIFRDYLFKRIKKNSPYTSKYLIIYFMCPGIYLNFFFFPFALLSTNLIILSSLGIDNPQIIWCGWMMLIIILLELFGETMMFVVIGYKEKVNLLVIIRNIISWWALTVTNSCSSLSALIFRTRPFEITGKGTHSINHRNVRRLEALFLLIMLFVNIFSLFNLHKVHINLYITVSILLTVLITSVFLLPLSSEANPSKRRSQNSD